MLGLAENSLFAYGYAIEQFLAYCNDQALSPEDADRRSIAQYVRFLRTRPNKRNSKLAHISSGSGLANATIVQWLTAIRLFYDYLVEEHICRSNPLGTREFKSKALYRRRGSSSIAFRRLESLPWIPSESDWPLILEGLKPFSPRDRLMFALSYDCALRREELCILRVEDIDPSNRMIRIRAETTKNRLERVLPFSETSARLLVSYTRARYAQSRNAGALFLSESNRNLGAPIKRSAWSKSIRKLAVRSGILQLHPHTFRHLCLTDLARAGWDIHEIARFAGHRSLASTLRYIHLSGRELREKLEGAMSHIHDQRVRSIAAT
ncbi:MAG: tyrosine-type recombinase/integrase [Vulcanimicrobiaceae bacterium]